MLTIVFCNFFYYFRFESIYVLDGKVPVISLLILSSSEGKAAVGIAKKKVIREIEHM